MMIARGRLLARVLDLARELVGLLEAEVGEHDARGGDGGENGLQPNGLNPPPPGLKLPGGTW